MRSNIDSDTKYHSFEMKQSTLAIPYDVFMAHAEERAEFRRQADEDFKIAREKYFASKNQSVPLR